MFNLLMYRCMETKNFQVVIKSYLEQLAELDAEFAVKYFDEALIPQHYYKIFFLST